MSSRHRGTIYQQILGADLGIHLHSRYRATSAAWVDGTSRISFAGNGSPTVGADGSFGRGAPAVQCASAGTQRYLATALSGLFPSGTRPWVYTVCRYRALTGNFPCALSLGSATTTQISLVSTISGVNFRGYLAPTVVLGPTPDTAVHGLGTWGDGVNVNISVDGVITTAANAAATAVDISNIGIGTGGSSDAGDTILGNISFWLILISRRYPGAAKAAAIHANARTEYSF